MGVSVVVLCRLEVINERPLNSQKKRTVVLTEKAAKDTFQYVSISGYKLPPPPPQTPDPSTRPSVYTAQSPPSSFRNKGRWNYKSMYS